MIGSVILFLEVKGKRLHGKLACGHVFVTSVQRTDLKVGSTCHCWDCDRETTCTTA